MARILSGQKREASLYVGDLSDHVTEEILYELFTQVAPVVSVKIPRDKVSGKSNGYGFVEFKNIQDAEYAIKILSDIKLFGVKYRLSGTLLDNEEFIDVGAKLFVGNLAPDVTEVQLQTVFKQFGNLQTCGVVVDPTTGKAAGHGFVSYDSFASSDEAIKHMNGQYLNNQPIIVSYAYKSDSKTGEKHGDKAERMFAPQALQKRNLQNYAARTNESVDIQQRYGNYE